MGRYMFFAEKLEFGGKFDTFFSIFYRPIYAFMLFLDEFAQEKYI